MTEKRYTIGFDKYTKNSLILENKEFFCRIHHIDKNKIIDRLNKQEELINTLREELELADKQNTKLEKENKQLKDENASMKGRIINAIVKSNQVECNCSPCICEDYVNEELKKW